jgi:hypothetical protein
VDENWAQGEPYRNLPLKRRIGGDDVCILDVEPKKTIASINYTMITESLSIENILYSMRFIALGSYLNGKRARS